MSIYFEDVLDQRSKNQEGIEPYEPRYNGRIVAIDGSVQVPGRSGWVWVRDQLGGVAPAFNGSVVETENVPVIITPYRESPTEWVIKDVDVSTLVAGGGDNTGFSLLRQHRDTHEWPANIPSTDAINIYPQAWTEFRTQPGTGLTINIAGGKYIYNGQWKYFTPVQSADISAYLPGAGLALFLLAYVGKAGNELLFAAGTAITNEPGIKPQTVDIPDNAIPSAYIRLVGGMTQIEWSDIYNARTFVNEATEALYANSIDGGAAASIYLTEQIADGGGA